jgi:transcription initiation factor TFIID subunit TAF12
MLSDTHPDAERVQIELLRQMTGAQRIAQWQSQTAFVVGLSRQAIARANPQLNEQEVNLLWVEYTYGKDLAKGLRDYLETRSPCNSQTS